MTPFCAHIEGLGALTENMQIRLNRSRGGARDLLLNFKTPFVNELCHQTKSVFAMPLYLAFLSE